MGEVINLIFNQKDLFMNLVFDHIKIALFSSFIAIVIGLSIGIFISRREKIASIVLGVVNVLYTIPAIALLGVLIPLTGIGNSTAIVALTIYALLPMVRSTYTGIKSIDEDILEAAVAMGSTEKELLLKVKLPLATPIIMSGIRNMVVMTIALTGIASFIGAGGLGVAIYRGITTNNPTMILAGSILVALLAIVFDAILGLVGKILQDRKDSGKKYRKILIPVLSLLIVFSFIFNLSTNKHEVRIATKPVTEGLIVGQILRIMIEENTDLKVVMTDGVAGGTGNIHPAMVKGDFDLYADYTGTIWQVVLKEKSKYDESMFPELEKKYYDKFKIKWINLLGFNSTFGLAVRKELADEYNLKTYSDLQKISDKVVYAAGYDYFGREDGYKPLKDTYNFNFKKIIDMDNGLKYKALLNNEVDAITVFTTDGQLSNPNIVLLEDDKHLHPSYLAGTVAREEILMKYPEIQVQMKRLEGCLDDSKMSVLNNLVETKGMKPYDVAYKFLKENGFLEVK